MKLKQFIALAVASITFASAQAGDTLKIYHTGGKTGTSMIFANEYAKDFKTKYKSVEATGPGGCLPVLKSLKDDTTTDTLVLWDTGVVGSDECRPEYVKHEPMSVFVSYYMLCTSADNNLTLNDFAKGNGRVALNVPLDFWANWFRDFGKASGANFTPVPVGDSGKLILSLVSKETDWAFIPGQRARAQVKDKKLRCVASTNPNGEDGLPFVGSVAPGFDRSELLLGWASYVKNASPADKAKIEAEVIAFHKSAEFQKFMKDTYIVDYTLGSAEKRKKFFDHMIHVMSGK